MKTNLFSVKGLASLILVTAFVLSLGGCESKQQAPDQTTSTTSTTTTHEGTMGTAPADTAQQPSTAATPTNTPAGASNTTVTTPEGSAGSGS